MNKFSLEESGLRDDQHQQNQQFSSTVNFQTLKKQGQISFQKLDCSGEQSLQKRILCVILVFLGFMLLYQAFSGSSKVQTANNKQILFTSENLETMINNSLSGLDYNKQQQSQALIDKQNLSKQRLGNAILLSQINNLEKQDQKISNKADNLLNNDKKYLEQKYQIDKYTNNPLGFCVIFPSIQMNQKGQYQSILRSILSQKYENYKVLYAQSDGAANKLVVSKLLKQQNFSSKKSFKIQKNNNNSLNNIFFGIQQYCSPNQVVLIINNASSLIGTNVFSLYNAIYQREKSSFVYSSYLKITKRQLKAELKNSIWISNYLNSKEINKYSNFEDLLLLSFSYNAFSQIPIQNFVYEENTFYSQIWQLALIKALLELSGQKKIFHLNEITYSIEIKQSQKYHSFNNVKYAKQIQALQKNKKLEQIQNSPLKEIEKNQMIKNQKDNYQNPHQIQNDHRKQTKQQIYIQNRKQKDQMDILQRQEQDTQLKEAVLKDFSQNQRNPLKEPSIIKLSQSLNQNAKHQDELHNEPQISKKQHKPPNKESSQSQEKGEVAKTQQILINGKKSLKSTQVLPIDEVGGFLQQQEVAQFSVPSKVKTQNPTKKKSVITGKVDVKGPLCNFAVPNEQMINNANLQKIFGKRKSKQGIWKNQFFQAIRKLQITNNVKYGGQMEIQITKFDNDKFQKIKRIQKLLQSQADYLQNNYKISQFKKKQLPFCIVVPSYQNVKTGIYLRNLNSIFMQNYTNYHVVYIDDASQDKTGDYVKSYLLSRQIPTEKIEIITNKENRKPPYNIYNAITNHCKLGQLALIIEGDDSLIGTNVLNLYNAVYQKDKSAMIYSNYLEIFNNSQVQLGSAHQIMDEYFQKNTIRSIWEIPGKYLLSFYVDIFKSIKVQQFKDPKGYFFWFAYDRALITPLLEVSYPRITIVKEILYEHRRDTDKNQSPADWNRQSGQILAKKPYKPLKFFPFIERNKYKYFFDAPINQVIQNSDFDGYKFQNNFQIEGISKQMHIRAIRMTQVVHCVDLDGELKIQLAEYQSSKQQKAEKIQKLLEQDKKYLNQKYQIDHYRKDQLPFCILTPSYNNVKSGLYLRNLDSVFMQDYSNYHVVYIDDCSPDKTGDFVSKYLEQKKIPKQKIEVIINKENKKALANIHLGIHNYCKSGQIVMIIDGDDSFIGRNILSLYNAVYQRDNAAMTYSNFLTIHNNDRTQLGFCHQINKEMFQQNTFRNSWDLPGTHLMTFYSDVFKKIKISDLTYPNGTFYDYAYDRAILTPLLQMAYPRISVIKQITYEYRNDTGINDSPDDWIRVSHIILDKKPYAHLPDFPFIKGLVVSTDKFNFKTSIQNVIKNTDFSDYEKQASKKRSGIAKQQHIHAIRLTELVHNINFKGEVEISLKSTKTPQKKKQRLEKLIRSDQQYLQAKYEMKKYKNNELPFCIIVSSYDNVRNGLYLRNLDSILMQDYKNYRLVYIDDKSSDEGHQYIKDYLEDKKIPSHVVKLIINKQTRKQLANIYFSAHNECKLNQIMLIVAGNDALIGRNVLNVLNSLYQNHNAQVGYGCFLQVFSNSTELGTCDQIDEFYFKTATFRNRLQFEKYRLMSFYTHLFRRIKVKDMTYDNGTFFNNAIDKAIMIPLIQMTYPNFFVAKQIMYEYRNDKGSQDIQTEAAETNLILGRNPYQKLDPSNYLNYQQKNIGSYIKTDQT